MIDEAQRLSALKACQILDTIPEQDFDDLVRLAAAICGAPIALITLIDAHRQWFKASFGLCISETPRELAFCQHAILQRDLMIVPDAHTDDRFVHNPFVTGEPYVRFYAGMPLTTSDGHNLGTLCVLDQIPRTLTPEQQEALRVLGRQVLAQIELRRRTARLEQEAERRKRAERVMQNKHIAAAVLDNAANLIVVLDQSGRIIQFNRAVEELTGWRAEEAEHRPFWEIMLRPEETGQLKQAFRGVDPRQFPLTYESILPTRGGQERIISWRVSAVCQLDELAYLVCCGVDLTDRICSEAERARLQEQVIATQAAALAELSTPLIPINNSVVVMPLIGTIDSSRAQQVLESLLRGIEQRRARTAILDITGVPVVDTQVADTLIRAAKSATLLGARVVLTGIRPELAQTLIGLGVDLRQVVTLCTLQAGIQYATNGG